jgi:dihydrofolate reductase
VWENSHVSRENVAAAVAALALKEQLGQDILLSGSADLVGTLTEHGLIDEYRLMIFPLLPRTGKRPFADGVSAALKLVEVKTLGSEIVVQTYQPEGKA